MSVTPLPTPPSRLDTTDFAERADEFLGALDAFVDEINNEVVTIVQAAAGIASSTSTTSVAIGTGSKSFTVGTGENFPVGLPVLISYDSTNWMFGLVTSYDTGTGALVVGVTHTAGSGTYADWDVVVSGVSTTTVNAQTFTASGTWTKPAPCTWVLVELLGAGGGGCSGDRRTATSATANGGGGGGGGALVSKLFLASELAATEAVDIGAGGAGGVGKNAAGIDGGNTVFGTALLTAYGGNGGTGSIGGDGGGSAPNGEPALSVVTATDPDNIGGGGARSTNDTSPTGCAEFGGAGGGKPDDSNQTFCGPGGSSLWGGAAGGAGGSYDSGFSRPAGAGGICGSYATGGGGAAGTNGASPTAGTAGANVVSGRLAGSGGGGGGGSDTLAVLGAAGGAGGLGCGGGGGGVSTAVSGNGGDGGDGGDGYCRVVAW